MSRSKTVDGKRVTITIKLSEAGAAAVDAARGTASRSAWGRDALMAQASGRAPAAAAPAASSAACPHPKARITKGLCNACGTSVAGR